MSDTADFDALSWMRDSDERVLEYLLEKGGLHRASGIDLNTDTDLSYGDVLDSLSRLEDHGLVERERWRYYRITCLLRTMGKDRSNNESGSSSADKPPLFGREQVSKGKRRRSSSDRE